jgi:hypothetical protein
MIHRDAESLADIINDEDIAAMSWVIAVFRQKIVTFFEGHRNHPPFLCPYADPEFIIAAMNLVLHLEMYVDAHNEYRVSQGLEPLTTFADSFVMGDGKHYDA